MDFNNLLNPFAAKNNMLLNFLLDSFQFVNNFLALLLCEMNGKKLVQ